MPRFDVRQLAAVDMYGTAGARWRRRVVVVEFVGGAIIGLGSGILVAAVTDTWGGWLFAAWLIGMGGNYLALATHALSLSRLGALDAELAGVDVVVELRYYGIAQLLLVVPLVVAVLALGQLPRRRHD